MVNHVTILKPKQCEYDRVRTQTVHHTNKRRTYQCKYDHVRTQRYTTQTREGHIKVSTTMCVHNGTPHKQDDKKCVKNINGTPPNHAKALSM